MGGKKPTAMPANFCMHNITNPKFVYSRDSGVMIWLQWYGESSMYNLYEKQFMFPVSEIDCFFEQPEKFEIFCIEEKTILFICPELGTCRGDKAVPFEGSLELNQQLWDANCGYITPSSFLDFTIKEDAMKKFKSIALKF